MYTQFGSPDYQALQRLVPLLSELRHHVALKNERQAELIKQSLLASKLLTYLQTFQAGVTFSDKSKEIGWIYILSTRKQPNILKIGMTNRSVAQRVKEINSATGVLIPYSARGVFRVQNAAKTEREIFALLDQYRLRSDREFFELPFKEAVHIIENHLQDHRKNNASPTCPSRETPAQ